MRLYNGLRSPFRALSLLLLAPPLLGVQECDAPSDPGEPVVGGVPVLFVHGLMGEGANSFGAMRAWLAANGLAGRELREMNLSNSQNCIEASAAEVAAEARRLLEDAGAAQLDLVGHSLGGLAARYYVKNLGGGAVVRNFVSITSPQHGTLAANPFAWPACAVIQMTVGSSFTKALNAGDETPGAAVRYTSIRGMNDVFVQPNTSPLLAGAHNVDTRLDHVQVLLRPESFEVVKAALEGGGANLN